MKIHNSDCLKVLRKMPSNSIDSIVTDPPYGISMMNETWDRDLPKSEIWEECFKVLKPGGYILSFASARLYHHLAMRLEQAGFETHNMLAWLYGNGFPKGQSLSMQFDKVHKMPKPDDEFRDYLKTAIQKSPYRVKDLEEMCGTNGMFSHYLGRSQPVFPNYKNWKILKKALKLDNTYDPVLKQRERFKSQSSSLGGRIKPRHFKSLKKQFKRSIPQSEEAKKWKGYRYGKMTLRPCLEPIYFGQKPPIHPMTENILSHGVGALNVEGSKVLGRDGKMRTPGNVMHDGHSGVVDLLTEKNKLATSYFNEFNFGLWDKPFFYIPKPSENERRGITHPTLKPVNLMRQLIKLVNPTHSTCLDPFMGSGTTGLACFLENVNFVGIEREREYFDMAQKRLKNVYSQAA